MKVDFEKHNKENKNQFARVIGMKIARQLVEQGLWEKVKDNYFVESNLSWSNIQKYQ